jgi:hypothetical protein
MTVEQFCIAEVARHARTLSYCDCLSFLSGFLLLADDAPEVQPLREIVAAMTQNDQQLELIAEAQLKFRYDRATDGLFGQTEGGKP